MKKLIYFLLLAYISGFAQQTPQYTQFMFEKNFYNPAYVGIAPNSVEGAVSVKSYLYSFSPDASYSSSSDFLQSLNKPTLVNVSLHNSSRKRNMAMGGRIELDKQPFLNQTYLTTYFSKRKKIGFNKLLSIGLELGVRNININQNNLKLISQDDQALKNDNPAPFNFFQPDLGIGAYFCEPRYYLALSVKNLVSFKYSWADNFRKSVGAQNYPHIYLNGGYKHKITNKFTVEGNGLYKMVLSNLYHQKSLGTSSRNNGIGNQLFNDLSVMDVNLMLEYNKTIALGASYRTNKTIAAIARFRMAERIYLSYAYDAPLANRATNSFKGNHEILLNYLVDFGNFVEKTIDPRYY